jgi:uncharacterized phage protein gp47/JayE
MPIQIPTFEEMRQRWIDAFKAAFPDFDSSRFGDDYKRGTVAAGLAFQLNHHLSVVADDVMPDSADGAQQDRHGSVYNVPRKEATPARKADALRLVGTVGSPFVLGAQLISQGGLTYQVNESGSIPAAGFLDVDVIAVDTGQQTKLQAGEVLRFVSAPPGIEVEAELQLDLDEDGEDAESNAAYRVRILNRIQQPGMGGNSNDFEQWAIEEPGIASAYVYPLRAGVGTVDLAALHSGSGTIRPLSSGERIDLLAAIDLKRPVSMKTGSSFRVLETLTVEQDVEITIEPTFDPAFDFDWDDSTPLVVATWTAGTRTLEFTTPRPTDMDEGDRIVLKPVGGGGTGEVFIIERFGAASDEVILDRAPSPAPVATDEVFAGGPLTDTVRDVLLGFIDSLGPAIGDHGVGNWEDSINPQRLEAISLLIEGVRNATTIIPAATVTPVDPAFPNDAQINLLIPQRVLVRAG